MMLNVLYCMDVNDLCYLQKYIHNAIILEFVGKMFVSVTVNSLFYLINYEVFAQ